MTQTKAEKTDTQKLGFWSGGSLAIEAEGNFIPQDNLSQNGQRQDRRTDAGEQQSALSDARG
jgi:hypothetical protein